MNDSYIHGIVSEKYKSWYIENSGTFWNGKQWVVDASKKEIVKYNAVKQGDSYRKGDLIDINVLKAEAFQEKMRRAKNKIIQVMKKVKGIYVISPDNIFDLIKGKKTEINYEYKNQKYKHLIKIT